MLKTAMSHPDPVPYSPGLPYILMGLKSDSSFWFVVNHPQGVKLTYYKYIILPNTIGMF